MKSFHIKKFITSSLAIFFLSFSQVVYGEVDERILDEIAQAFAEAFNSRPPEKALAFTETFWQGGG